MHSRISIRGSVCPSVHMSVCQFVGQSVSWLVNWSAGWLVGKMVDLLVSQSVGSQFVKTSENQLGKSTRPTSRRQSTKWSMRIVLIQGARDVRILNETKKGNFADVKDAKVEKKYVHEQHWWVGVSFFFTAIASSLTDGRGPRPRPMNIVQCPYVTSIRHVGSFFYTEWWRRRVDVFFIYSEEDL